MIMEEEWEIFTNICASKEDKDLRQWDLDMHRMNIGSVTLGVVTTARGQGGKRRTLIL
jgi:hypothetical protein